MEKNTKKQVLFLILLFSLLSVSCFNSPSMAPVSAVDNDVQNAAIEILNDVISLNQKNYSIIVDSIGEDQFRNLPQKEVNIRLISVNGSLRVKTSFVNNVLRQIYVTNYKGDFTETKSVSDITESAKNFLKNYRNYAEDSFYDELSLMLDDVDATKNMTKTINDIKLEVFNTEQKIVEYIWTYTDENGIVAESKNVILSYRNGQLNVFLNNWPLYNVANAPKISAEDATKIALKAANTFSYEVIQNNITSTISGFEIAPESLGFEILNYQNFPTQTLARENDPFTLYPSWYVPVGFNKTYPGGVTGLTITIWADTGEISSINKMRVGINPETSEEQEESIITSEGDSLKDGLIQNLTLLFVPLAAITSVGAFGIALISRKKIKKIVRTKKLFPSFWGALLCGLLMLTAVFTATPSAFAVVNPDCKAEIYAPYALNPPQLPEEIVGAEYVIAQIKADFQSAGYTATNWTDYAVTVEGVLENASYDEINYDRVALFHFGHLADFNIGYQDGDGNQGTNIWATGETSIDSAINSQKHDFVFIWVCAQAQSPAVGSTAAAWTQRTDLISTGYSDPDQDGQVYIGFEGFSPPINNASAFEGLLTGPMLCWIEDFYEYALCDEYIVNDAINQATLDFFDTTFTASILNTGYSCWWAGNPPSYSDKGYYSGAMRIFGDGSMGAFNPTLSISAGTGGYTSPSGSPSFTFGDNALVYPHAYANYVFSHWTLDGEYYSSNALAQVPMEEDHALHAVFSYVPPTYALSISAGAGGSTSPSPGTHYYSSGTPVQVSASPNANYDFDHWNLDGSTYYNNPITVTMNTNHNLQAYFSYDPPTYPLTVNAYANGGAIYVPFYLDGDYVGTTMSTYYVTAGTHSVAVPAEPNPYLTFDYWVGVSGGTVNVQGSTTITAYYIFHGK